jgi:hypothetical protein
MTLREQQSKFAHQVALLILQAEMMGYAVTFGDAYRDPRLHGSLGIQKGYGSAHSFHKKRLAIDLNLFKDGVYLEGSAAHSRLGEWWESQGGTWGGRFKDGNHYSWGEG